MDAELRKHYALGDLFALALELGVTVRAVRSRAKKIGCRREVNVGRAWSERELEVLRESYPVMSAREVAALVGHSEKAVWSRSRKLGLKTSSEFIRSRGRENAQHPRSVATRFQKGLVPKNKGVRIERWMSAEGLRRSRAVRFKKGHVPANTKPVGYERLSKDGYVYIKACDGMPMVLKHRWVWEQAHGAIPKGYNVMFVDGDRTNCALGNLRLVSRGDAARRQVLMESAEKRRQRCERSCASRNEAIRRDKLRIHWGLEPYTKLVKRW
jgi:hypothetical protein